MTATEPRALSTVTSSAPAFRPRMSAMVDHAVGRHVDRWAPEQGATRSGSLRALAFTDRIIAPWFDAPERMTVLHGYETLGRSGAALSSENASWVFPRPWYQDEVNWLAASRQTQDAARPVLTTRGTYVAPRSGAPSPSGFGPLGAPPPMELVAPSLSSAGTLGTSSSAGLPARAPSPGATALSAWSSLVPFAAAQAAQVVAGTLQMASRSGLAVAERSPILSALSYVSPAELASGPSMQGALPGRAAPLAGLGSTTVQRQLAAAVARFDSVAAEPVIAARAASAPAMVTPPSPVAEARPAVSAAEARSSAPAVAPPASAGAARPSVIPPTPVAPTAAPAASVAPSVATPAPSVATPAVTTTEAASQIASRDDLGAERARVASEAAASGLDVAGLRQLLASSPEAAVAMRSLELLTRGAASGESHVAPAAGPRVALPAGLGGVAAAMRAADAISRPLAVAAPMTFGALPLAQRLAERGEAIISPELATSEAVALPRRPMAFQPVWTAPSTTISAVAAERPAAIGHVAWADRWLARFSGASANSLGAFELGAEPMVPRSIAAGAPEVVFVAPMFARREAAAQAQSLAAASPSRPSPAAMPSQVAAARISPPMSSRVDETEAVSDDVFAALARARASAPRAPAAGTPAAATAAAPQPQLPTIADMVASTPPSAPGAGLQAGIAASPLAPALANLLTLPQVTAFDPRALFSSGLAMAYATGLLAPSATVGRVGAIGMSGLPALAGLGAPGSPLAFDAVGGLVAGEPETSRLAGLSPSIEYVVPPGDERAAEPDARAVSRGPAQARGLDDVAGTPAALRPTAAPSTPATAPAFASAGLSAQALADARAELVSVQTSLLSSPAAIRDTSNQVALMPGPSAAWAPRPGVTAERAHTMAVQHERASSDLAFDFVGPELVLAARAYGFGPVEAAQAARLAVSGPSGLAAMATAVDLTFLRAVQERRDQVERSQGRAESRSAPAPSTAPTSSMFVPTTAYPAAASSDAGASVAQTSAPATSAPAASAMAASAMAAASDGGFAQSASPAPGERHALFGVERRLPRGAFLWPAGAVAALGLEVPIDATTALPVAALELLAASAVADLGAWVTAQNLEPESVRAAERGLPFSSRRDAASLAGGSAEAGFAPGYAPGLAPGFVSSGSAAAGFAPGAVASPAAEAEAVATQVALPSADRGRFQAVYLALTQSSVGQSLSPSARVARALAVMARGEEGSPSSALERAAAAWSALPLVLGGDVTAATANAAATRTGASIRADARPGLSQLSSRAGDFLGALVSPGEAEVMVRGDAAPGRVSMSALAPSTTYVQVGAESESPRERASSSRASSRTGLPFARHGGGEVEIPSWFEEAARNLFESGGGSSEGISLAELTLISSAGPSQIAAASKSGGAAPAASAPGAQGGAGAQDHKPKPDVEQIAQDVFAEVLKMFDVMRARNGEPTL